MPVKRDRWVQLPFNQINSVLRALMQVKGLDNGWIVNRSPLYSIFKAGRNAVGRCRRFQIVGRLANLAGIGCALCLEIALRRLQVRL